MKSAFIKNVFREIKNTFNRFISIFAIVALGVGFVAGLKSSAPSMRHSADIYFDNNNFMDIYILSTYGFTEDDVSAFSEQNEIASVYAAYSLDVLFSGENGSNAVKVMDLPEDSSMNLPEIKEGRFPSEPNECVVDSRMVHDSDFSLGKTISLSEDSIKSTYDSLVNKTYTIVGVVDTPQYLSFQRDSTNIGNGSIKGYIYIPTSNFSLDYYTALYACVNGAKELSAFSEAYDLKIESVCEALEVFADERESVRYETIITEASDELNKAKEELEEKKAETDKLLSDASKELSDARNEIEQAKKEISDNEIQLDFAEQELSDKRILYEKEIAKKTATLSSGQAEYDKAYKVYEQTLNSIVDGEEALKILSEKIQTLVEAGELQQAEVLTQQYNEQEEIVETAKLSAVLLKTNLDTSLAELESGYSALEEAKKTALKSFEDAKKQISDGRNELSAAKTKLESGEKDLNEKEFEFEDKKNEAEKAISDAEAEITKAENDIAAIEKPVWYVLDRQSNIGYAGFSQDTDKVDAIAAIFPVFFLLVAVLVCLTAMTRMVDEQRTQIGVYKALGYGKIRIALKYLLYAGIACISGCVVGLCVGIYLFPTIIMQAYNMMYNIPALRIYPDITMTVLAPLAFLLFICGSTLWACLDNLRAVPAELIRPNSPPRGKKIFLEKIRFLWKKLTFSQKVTIRNIVRYKKRFFMTIIGIMGCTALVLTGFGLSDSINGILTKQFDEIFQYDISVSLKSPEEPSEKNELKKNVDKLLDESVFLQQSSVDASNNSVTLTANLIVPEDTAKLSDLITFRDRITHNPVYFTDENTVITEKLASQLGVSVGDTFIVKYGETSFMDVTVGGICENYTYSYIYMSAQQYLAKTGENPEYKTIWARYLTETEDSSVLSQELLENENIEAVVHFSDTRANFSDVLKSLNSVVVAVVVSAGCLAFVVLYNLVNITINERIREIATIKVLGFNDAEVAQYVFRENAILSVIGTGVGLIAGIFLHQFVVTTAEVEMVMFWRAISWQSYLYAVAVMFFFAAAVNSMMYFKLKKISMVESLKSVE